MKTITGKQSEIFHAIINKLEDGYLKLDNDKNFMALSVECIGGNNLYNFYSFAHYYEQNGDLMRDPEVCFAVDKDKNIIPYSFRNDGLGIFQESIHFDTNCYFKRKQADLTAFCFEWLNNIKDQQKL